MMNKKNMHVVQQANRTKIVATVGPATSDVEVLQQMIVLGCSVFRINFSHGTHAEHAKAIVTIRQASENLQQHVAILGDLQGPKIRIGAIIGDSIVLTKGQKLLLDSDIDDDMGGIDGVSYRCDSLAQSCEPGKKLLLDDGRVQLEVVKIEGKKIFTTVLVGDKLSSRKGLNLQGGGLAEAALTKKDAQDVAFAATQPLDYICVSFPANAQHMQEAKELLEKHGCVARIIAKIERAEVVQSQQNIDEIINSCDGVMVARGDLAIEVGFAKVTSLQKQIVHRARVLNKPVIVATQMMESMIESPVPTRAEVSDVANAVFDYADAVMLSAETAVGKYPLEVIQTVYNVIVETEQNELTQISNHRIECDFHHVDESIAMAATYLANHFKGIKAIVCLTESGSTTLWMSRIKTHLPMMAVSTKVPTLQGVALYRGVIPTCVSVSHETKDTLFTALQQVAKAENLSTGDYVVVTYGDVVGVDGHTNNLKIVRLD